MTRDTDQLEAQASGKKDEEALTGLAWWKHEARELAVTIAVFLPIWMVFTTVFYELRSIPSESMVPALQVGDRVAVAKFPYGYDRNSLVFGLGRVLFSDDPANPNEKIFASMPERGDVVVFKHPHADKVMIKRLIGLPGDTIEMRGGALVLNGEPAKREEVRRLRYVPAHSRFVRNAIEYRETLPNGKSYLVHEFPGVVDYDETPVFTVPPGHVFMIGDNRDNSEDSRAPSGHPGLAAAHPQAWGRPVSPVDEPVAIGYVPLDNLIGRAETVLFSLYSCRKAPDAECAKGRIWKGL